MLDSVAGGGSGGEPVRKTLRRSGGSEGPKRMSVAVRIYFHGGVDIVS